MCLFECTCVVFDILVYYGMLNKIFICGGLTMYRASVARCLWYYWSIVSVLGF